MRHPLVENARLEGKGGSLQPGPETAELYITERDHEFLVDFVDLLSDYPVPLRLALELHEGGLENLVVEFLQLGVEEEGNQWDLRRRGLQVDNYVRAVVGSFGIEPSGRHFGGPPCQRVEVQVVVEENGAAPAFELRRPQADSEDIPLNFEPESLVVDLVEDLRGVAVEEVADRVVEEPLLQEGELDSLVDLVEVEELELGAPPVYQEVEHLGVRVVEEGQVVLEVEAARPEGLGLELLRRQE